MKRSCRAALFAFLAFLVLATAAYAQGSSKTHFLIARPGMPDPNFRETVVLVTHEEGAEATASSSTGPPTARSPNVAERALQTLQGADILRRAVGLKACSPYSRLTSFPAGCDDASGLYLAVVPDSIDALLNNPPPKIRSSRATPDGPRASCGENSTAATGRHRSRSRRGFPEGHVQALADMVRRASAVRADAALTR